MSIRVLIADDEAAARKITVFTLGRAHGIEIVGEAEDGPSALALAKEVRPDVVVLDNHMPGMTGLEVAQALAAELPRTGIVLRTMDPDAEARARARGIQRTLAKDAPVERLIQLIREASSA